MSPNAVSSREEGPALFECPPPLGVSSRPFQGTNAFLEATAVSPMLPRTPLGALDTFELPAGPTQSPESQAGLLSTLVSKAKRKAPEDNLQEPLLLLWSGTPEGTRTPNPQIGSLNYLRVNGCVWLEGFGYR